MRSRFVSGAIVLTMALSLSLAVVALSAHTIASTAEAGETTQPENGGGFTPPDATPTATEVPATNTAVPVDTAVPTETPTGEPAADVQAPNTGTGPGTAGQTGGILVLAGLLAAGGSGLAYAGVRRRT